MFAMHVHLVFVAKYRKGVFTKAILKELFEIFQNVCKAFEATLIEFDGVEKTMYAFLSIIHLKRL